jgi:hypothetical protein
MEVHSSLKLTKLLMKMCLVHLIWILFTILTETNNGNNVQAIYHGNPDNVHKSKFGCVILLSHVFLLHPLPKLLLKFYSKSYSYLKYNATYTSCCLKRTLEGLDSEKKANLFL